MKKKIAILLVLLLSSCNSIKNTNESLNQTGTKKDNTIKENLINLDDKSLETNSGTINEKLNSKDKINILKKRFALKSSIMAGDEFLNSNLYSKALDEYKKVLQENPQDKVIIKKVAYIYFETYQFKKLLALLESIKTDLDSEELEQYILSLIYTNDLTKNDNIIKISETIKNLAISKEEKVYYINALNCLIDLHGCKIIYEDYFKTNETLTFSKFINLKKAFENYEKFQSKEIYYKDTLMIGSFFQDKLYPISTILAKSKLQEKPSYKPLIQIIGEGYYKLGLLENSKKYLLTYNSLEPNNKNIAYTLGDIFFKKNDYTNSNIYFNVALKNGFDPKISILKKLIYNYYLLGDKKMMLNTFADLIQDNNSTINDYSLGIYHAILQGDQTNAITWANLGLEKFKNTTGYEIFYGYLGWIYRESNDTETAKTNLKLGLSINPKNPLILLNYGYIEKIEQQFPQALMYFKRTLNINGEGEFGELATQEIQEIEKYIESQKTLEGSGNIISQ